MGHSTPDRSSSENLPIVQYLLPVLFFGSEYLAFTVLIPIGVIMSGGIPQASLSSEGSSIFSLGYALALAFLLSSVSGSYEWFFFRSRLPRMADLPPGMAVTLHKAHVILLTVVLPGGLLAGFLCTAITLRNAIPRFEWYLGLALWYETAYVLAFPSLSNAYGGLFCMNYQNWGISSLWVARDLALTSLKRFEEGLLTRGLSVLRNSYLIASDWLRSTGYSCKPLDQALGKLSLAYDLDAPLSADSLRSLAGPIEKLPDWALVTRELEHLSTIDLDWSSTISPIRVQRAKIELTRALEILLSLMVAVGTLATAFPETIRNAGIAITSSPLLFSAIGLLAVWVGLTFCWRYWWRLWNTLYYGLTAGYKILDEQIQAKH